MFLISLPLSFHYVLGVCIFIIHFSKLSPMPGTILALNLSDKCIISSSKYLYILFTLILNYDKVLLLQIEFTVLILLIVLLQNQNLQQKILTSLLPPTQPLFTASATNVIVNVAYMYMFLT